GGRSNRSCSAPCKWLPECAQLNRGAMMFCWVIRRPCGKIAKILLSKTRQMPNRSSSSPSGSSNAWLRVSIAAVLLGIALYSAWQKQRATEGVENPATVPEVESQPADVSGQNQNNVIARQTIRDQDGRVAFRGDVDVGPTLDRIRRNERLPFSHDGIVFQNRER